MQSILAFLLGISLLVTLHEAGHFAFARFFGVKVLTFSVGFGRPLISWVHAASGTRYSIGWIPLGGYVRMLDRREDLTSTQQASSSDLSFDQLVWWKRSLIVVAGPLANLLVAVLLFAVIPWSGLELPVARVSEPPVGSLMQQAGIQSGDWIRSVRDTDDEERRAIHSYADLQSALMSAWARGSNLSVEVVKSEAAAIGQEIELSLSDLPEMNPQEPALERLGLLAPYSPAVIHEVVTGGRAQQAGLWAADEILRIDNTRVLDAQHLRALIQGAPERVQTWEVRRQEQLLSFQVHIEAVDQSGRKVGKAGIQLAPHVKTVWMESGVWESLWQGAMRTYDMSKMSLQIMARMMVGEASLQHLSGPVRMAQAAGDSAARGWMAYVSFLGLISASIAVLNLLPIPMLDGGHLMYYLWEGVTGRPVAESLQVIFHKIGLLILFAMMALALSNDLLSLFSVAG